MFIELVSHQGFVCIVHEVGLAVKVVANGMEYFTPLQVLDEYLALVRASCRQDHVLLKVDIDRVVEPTQHYGTTLRACEVRELVPDSLVLDKFFVINRRQRHILELLLHEGMTAKLIDRHSIGLNRL